MEEEKKEQIKQSKGSKIIIILLLCITIVLGVLTVYMFNKIKQLENNEIRNDKDNLSITKSVSDEEIKVNIEIGNVSISKDSQNSKIKVDGKLNLSYDNNKYIGIGLSGYCIGTNNEKYEITGPADGRAYFHDDENRNLSMTECVPSYVEYPDGTRKEWSEVDWSNVKIKYCKIDKMTAYLEDNLSIEKELNYEKKFDIDSNENEYKAITEELKDDAFYVTKAIKNGDNYTLQGVIYKKYTIAESELQRGYVDIYGERYFVEKNDDGNYYFTNSEVFHIGKLEKGDYALIGNDQIGTRWELTEEYGEIIVSSNTKCVFPYGVGDDTNVKNVEEVFKNFKEVKPHDNIRAGDNNLFYLNKFENGKCTELYCAHTSI